MNKSDSGIPVTKESISQWIHKGKALYQSGRLAEAIDIFRQVLALAPDHVEARFQLANWHAELGKLDEAIEEYQRIIAQHPYAGVYINLGSAFQRKGMFPEAQACLESALQQKPDHVGAWLNLGDVFRDQKRFDEATGSYLKAAALAPDYPASHNKLGLLFARQGRLQDAFASFQAALKLNPNDADVLNNLGSTLVRSGRAKEAMPYLGKALALKPDFIEAHNNLGLAYKAQGRLEDAIKSFKQALAMRPDYVEGHNNLGIVLQQQGKFDQAISGYQYALRLRPDSAETHNNLGNLFRAQARLDEALACFQNAIALNPESAETYNNLGGVLKEKGRLDEAIACFRKTLALRPDFVQAHSNYLYACLYSEHYTSADLLALHKHFSDQHEQPLMAHWLPHSNTRDVRRRLKIGYVSADFRRHPVAYFIESVFQHHDKSQVELFCYYSHSIHDEVTQRLMNHADHWIVCTSLSEEELSQRIRADGIDILIDLSGHSGGNRLGAFMRKPAPVQATYLGYPATTGLRSIDYRLTDRHSDPSGMTEGFNSERLWRLPETVSCYRARNDSPAVVDRPPMDERGNVTFGCFNNYSKLSDRTLALWARILGRLPSAHLMLEIQGVDGAQFRAEVEARLVQSGLPLERIRLIARDTKNQYVLYNQIDIALDPFPYNGGTTSFDTLWMGVPFVTLAGSSCVSRLGVSILTNAGLNELVAQTEDAYLEIAVSLAQDAPRLRKIRNGLRERAMRSPLMDGARFTRHIEQAYRDMWKTWCEQATTV